MLTSLFNLLRVITFRQDGNLNTIDAVLGAPICLPTCFNTLHDADIFEDFNADKSKLIFDMYFYTINWMRELVSAYATQEELIVKVNHFT